MDPNTQHLGAHVLGEQLHQDNTGKVFRAVHAASNDPVTITVLDQSHARDPDVVARFERQAGALRRLHHPGIIQVLDHGQSDLGPYVVVENLVGESLADRLKREGKLPLPETQHIIGILASALTAAYRLRIAQPELTPDDIFLAERGAEAEGGGVKLRDLGLAKLVGDQGAPGRKSADQRTGILALGRLAYQMLSGQAPVEESVKDDTGGERKRSVRLSALGVAVPAPVEAAIMKALQRRKKRRFVSMIEFAREMGIDVKPPTLPSPDPEVEIDLDADSDVQTQAEAEPEDYGSDLSAMAARALPPPLPPSRTLPPVMPPSPEPSAAPASAGGFAVRAGALSKSALRSPRTVAVAAAGAAAALVIGWFAIRPATPPDKLAVVATAPARVDVAREAKPSASAGVPAAPSRVDEILALNQKAVSAHEASDFKTARTLLQDADQLAVASGYAEAPVRAQTQVRLGALYVAQKNMRVGRRYLAKAVAINPAVRLPPGMNTPQVHKVLIATKKARLAKSAPAKRAKGTPARRQTRT